MPHHVSKAEFARLVECALDELPEPFAQVLEEVPVEIHDRPSPKLLKSVGLTKNDLLLGLYHGRALTERSVEDSARLPDVIYIFQDHIEQVAANADDLIRETRTTVLHEIGHHFGMSEEDLDKLGYG